jgi:poly(A) polymerase
LPILYNEPTQWDIEQSGIIKTILKDDYNQYEKDIRARTQVMNELNNIIREWVKICGRKLGFDEEQISTWGGKIFEFGSYRLDVHTPGTDIDALVVAPVHIDRDKHFFEVLPEMLQKNKEQYGIKKLILVREAFVPCIKMVYKGVDIDLLFARIEWKEVGDNIKSL